MPHNINHFDTSAANCGFRGFTAEYRPPGIFLTLILLVLLFLVGCATDPATKLLPSGWQQLQTGQADQALATADKILDEAPNSPRAAEVLYLKGRAFEAKVAASPAEQRTNLSNAYTAYSAALRANPSEALAGRIYSGIANTYYWQDDYSNAWRNWVKGYDLTSEEPEKAYMLYRIGLCQQRLGQFEEADRTLAAVQKEYPNTDAARRAAGKRGARAFSVQVATFATPQSADNAMNTLRREGFVPSKQANAQGQTVIMVTPFPDYQQAQSAKARLAGLFPDALILP